ncbi:MAG: ketoacyl-ACP synthase III [Bacteroidales bacterium]|nr:ketoacyl-ACP synthase III [Bacteroidales bacterium]
MALFSIHNIKISGIAVGVPKLKINNFTNPLLQETERALFIKTTGVESVRRVENKCLSDLMVPTAQKLLSELKWQAADVHLLICVTQTPDYPIPPTGIILQDKLKMDKKTLAFDINLGCSGYVYGLSVAASMMKSTGIKKSLLCVGDISSSCISKTDKSTTPLFSDAVSVTALEYRDDLNFPMTFNLQSDGSGFDAIIINNGGSKNYIDEKSLQEIDRGGGVIRKDIHMTLDGIKVFNFALREVATNIQGLLDFLKKTSDDYNYFIFHQANLLMNESIRKKLKLPEEKVPYSIKDFGNTSSASIPVTIVSSLKTHLENKSNPLILSGFGVGLSWGSVSLLLDNIVCPDIIEI